MIVSNYIQKHNKQKLILKKNTHVPISSRWCPNNTWPAGNWWKFLASVLWSGVGALYVIRESIVTGLKSASRFGNKHSFWVSSIGVESFFFLE